MKHCKQAVSCDHRVKVGLLQTVWI